MRSPRLLWSLALLAAFVLAPRSTCAAETIDVPVGIPVQLDGIVGTAEWQDALSLEFAHATATLRVKQMRGTLLFGFSAEEHWVERSELVLYMAPDAPAEDLGAWSHQAFTIRYEPLTHNRPHLIVTRQDQGFTQRTRGEVVAASALEGSHATAELAVPLKALGIEGVTDPVVRLAAMWVRPGAVGSTATIPTGLDVRARADAAPTDLGSSRNWARLAGLRGASEPGAFSPTQWKTWTDLHDEIANRGESAYALYREIDEERRQFLKQDALVESTILDALRWIGEREALSEQDRLLMARAYRSINRYDEALAVLDGLVGSRSPYMVNTAMYERAKVLRSMERFEEEALVWKRLAARSGPALRNRYGSVSADARELLLPWKREQTLRAENDARDLPLVELRTNRGRVVIELFPDDVPKAVAHFLSLVRSGFYDGLRFHRVLGEQLAQGGDPKTRGGDCTADGVGAGASETRIEIEQNRRHGFWRGAVGFAVGRVQENGSQFFILTGPRPNLIEDNGQVYTCFGRVVAGMAAVDRIEWCDTLIAARVLYEPKAADGSKSTSPDETNGGDK